MNLKDLKIGQTLVVSKPIRSDTAVTAVSDNARIMKIAKHLQEIYPGDIVKSGYASVELRTKSILDINLINKQLKETFKPVDISKPLDRFGGGNKYYQAGGVVLEIVKGKTIRIYMRRNSEAF